MRPMEFLLSWSNEQFPLDDSGSMDFNNDGQVLHDAGAYRSSCTRNRFAEQNQRAMAVVEFKIRQKTGPFVIALLNDPHYHTRYEVLDPATMAASDIRRAARSRLAEAERRKNSTPTAEILRSLRDWLNSRYDSAEWNAKARPKVTLALMTDGQPDDYRRDRNMPQTTEALRNFANPDMDGRDANRYLCTAVSISLVTSGRERGVM